MPGLFRSATVLPDSLVRFRVPLSLAPHSQRLPNTLWMFTLHNVIAYIMTFIRLTQRVFEMR